MGIAGGGGMKTYGPDRRQGDYLFRGGDHAGAVPGARRGKSGASGSRDSDRMPRPPKLPCRRRRPRSPRYWSISSHPASSTPWRATMRCRSWYSLFFSALPVRQSALRRSPWWNSVLRSSEVMFRYTRYVMYLAPIGVGAAIAVTVGSKGIAVLFGLGKLILTMYVSALLCIVLVLAPALFLFKIPARRFLARRARTVPDRVLHSVQRSRPAAGARKHGAVRRAQAHRRLRDSHRL